MGTLVYCEWECKLVPPIWRAALHYPGKFKMHISYFTATISLRTFSRLTLSVKSRRHI